MAEERVLNYNINKYYFVTPLSELYNTDINELEAKVMKCHPKMSKGFFANNIPEYWKPEEYANYLIDNPDNEDIKKSDLNPDWDEYYWYAVKLRNGWFLESYNNVNDERYLVIQYDSFEEDDEDYTLLKERQIFKCINEGRNISRWIVRILREVLEQRDEAELFKTFFEDDYYFKFHADKLKKLSSEWKEGRIKGYIELDYKEWIISKYKGDRIYDLLDALHWFTKNNNCCNRHKNDFPVWNGSIDSSYLDYCERCEIEDEDLEEELFKDDYLSDYHLTY